MIWNIDKKRKSASDYYHRRKEKLGAEVVFAERKLRNQRNRRNQQQYLFYEAKTRAKKRGLEFTITRDDVVIPKICPVFGIEIKRNEGANGPWDYSPTIDRVDNSKGYTKDNIRIISWKANRAKGDHSIDELKAVIRYMEDHFKKKES